MSEPMNEQRILDLMAELGALKKGHFLLSSGLHSDTYFQCAQVLQFPDLASELGRMIGASHDPLDIDLVVSPALGAVLLGHEVARALGRRFVFTERQEGKMTLRRGFAIEQARATALRPEPQTLLTVMALTEAGTPPKIDA